MAIQLHELPPSPNNTKVRIGLAYKGLEYERRPFNFEAFPGDRTPVVDLSGQPLTPVLVHDDRVMFDSGAILRYLEANFRDTPPLFSADYQEMKAIEEWEWTARTRLSEPVRMMFRESFTGKADGDTVRRACKLMHELTGRIEDQLSKTPFLVGDRMTAADVTAVPLVHLATLEPRDDAGPVVKFFIDNFRLGEGRDAVRAWVGKVIAHDVARGGL